MTRPRNTSTTVARLPVFQELGPALRPLRNPVWAVAAFAIVESSTAFKKKPMPLVMQYLQ